MFYLADVLEFVVDCFDDRTFAQHDLVVHAHQAVFHVVTDIGDQVYVVYEQDIGQFFGQVAFIGKQFAENRFQEPLVPKRFAVVHIGLCDGKVYYFALIIDDNVQFEPVKPAHGGFSYFSYAFEHLVPFDAFVVAYPYWRGIDERDTSAYAKATGF